MAAGAKALQPYRQSYFGQLLRIAMMYTDKEKESKKTTERFLKNPLPVPKRRPHVKMEFDLSDDWDIPEEQDQFDIEIDEDDDFDL